MTTFDREPEEVWREPLSALRVTLRGDPKRVDVHRAQHEIERLLVALIAGSRSMSRPLPSLAQSQGFTVGDIIASAEALATIPLNSVLVDNNDSVWQHVYPGEFYQIRNPKPNSAQSVFRWVSSLTVLRVGDGDPS